MSKRPRVRASGIIALCASLCFALGGESQATIIVDDSWADGGRDDGADPQDINWWTSAVTNGIEVSPGSMGLVTGGSGRGIHGIFPTQTLANVGDKLVATYTFTTPATIGSGATGGFRVGLFDTLGRAGLNANVASSSGTPNALFGHGTGASPAGPGTAGLPGYMLDMDVGTGAEDLSFRKHDTGTVIPTGRLMGTTGGFAQLSPTGPDGVYTFTSNTTYTGSLSITRVSATQLELTGTLGTATHTVTDAFDSDPIAPTNYGLIAFWANSNVFGSSSTPGQANNGIDFSNIKIEFFAIPEPTSLVLIGMAGMAWGIGRNKRS